MRLVFSDQAWEDYLHWQQTDPTKVEKINTLIKDVKRDPFKGLGKPEPLKGPLAGWWSLNRPVFLGQWVECIHAAAPVPRRS